MQNSTYKKILEYFLKNYSSLDEKKFHFSSRLYLWTKEDLYLKQLADIKSEYIGENEQDHKNILIKIMDAAKTSIPDRQYAERKQYIEKYPLLRSYDRVLFKYIFCKHIYNIDLTSIIEKLITDVEIINLYNSLINDKEALSKLSTFAINFIYLAKYYLDSKGTSTELNPKIFLDIVTNTSYSLNAIELQVYLLTHCIIGESLFYSRKVTNEIKIYLEMNKFIENLIKKYFTNISLDNKLEFLVCTKLLSTNTELEKSIFEEAEKSISNEGYYIIDKFNSSADTGKKDLIRSEHRNVLYLMSKSKFI